MIILPDLKNFNSDNQLLSSGSGFTSLGRSWENILELRLKSSKVICQLEEDMEEILKNGDDESVPDIISSHGYEVCM